MKLFQGGLCEEMVQCPQEVVLEEEGLEPRLHAEALEGGNVRAVSNAQCTGS